MTWTMQAKLLWSNLHNFKWICSCNWLEQVGFGQRSGGGRRLGLWASEGGRQEALGTEGEWGGWGSCVGVGGAEAADDGRNCDGRVAPQGSTVSGWPEQTVALQLRDPSWESVLLWASQHVASCALVAHWQGLTITHMSFLGRSDTCSVRLALSLTFGCLTTLCTLPTLPTSLALLFHEWRNPTQCTHVANTREYCLCKAPWKCCWTYLGGPS